MSTAIFQDVDAISPPPSGWDRSGSFSADDVIHAHDVGVNKRAKEIADGYEKMLRKQFVANYERAHIVAEKLFTTLVDSNVEAISAHLKAEDLFQFEVIIIVSPKTFYSEQINVAYALAQASEENNREDTFSISFSFMKYSPHISAEALVNDGYLRYYEPEAKESKGDSQ